MGRRPRADPAAAEIDPQKSVRPPRTIAWMGAKVEWWAPNNLVCT